jgi:hypothetical protein
MGDSKRVGLVRLGFSDLVDATEYISYTSCGEPVEDLGSAAFVGNQPDVAENREVIGDGRDVASYGGSESGHTLLAGAELVDDQEATGMGECLADGSADSQFGLGSWEGRVAGHDFVIWQNGK